MSFREEFKPLATSETISRLEREVQALFNNLDAEPVRVGSAEAIVYDRDWAIKNKVGAYGRMTISEGLPVYHVAPSKVDRRERYDFKKQDVFSYINSFVDGRGIENISDKLLKIDLPIPKENPSTGVADYEKALFFKIVAVSGSNVG